MRRLIRPAILLSVLALAACSEREEDAAATPPVPVEPPRAGIYAGTFPCEDCPGIEVTLWLRDDQRFFLRQAYAAADEREGETYYGLGRWRWRADDERLVLSGPGPDREFARLADDTLEMITTTGLPHELARLADAPAFGDTLALEGEFTLRDGVPLFYECHTELTWTVSKGGDYRRLRHQYGTLPRGKDAYLELEGRLVATDDGELLLIERLIRVREDVLCD